jgi:hypothetical protein
MSYRDDENSVSTITLATSCLAAFLIGIVSVCLYRQDDNKFYHLTCSESGKTIIDLKTKYAKFSSNGTVNYTDAKGTLSQVSSDCKIEQFELSYNISDNKIITRQRIITSESLTKAEQIKRAKDSNKSSSDDGGLLLLVM